MLIATSSYIYAIDKGENVVVFPWQQCLGKRVKCIVVKHGLCCLFFGFVGCLICLYWNWGISGWEIHTGYVGFVVTRDLQNFIFAAALCICMYIYSESAQSGQKACIDPPVYISFNISAAGVIIV